MGTSGSRSEPRGSCFTVSGKLGLRTPGNCSRGTHRKTPIAAVLDRPTKRVRARVLPDTIMRTITDFVRSGLKPGAALYTDEATAYTRLPEYDHEAVKHSALEYVRGEAHTNGPESFWSTFKRAYHGTYHHLSTKHLQRYVDEYASRHNVRDADTLAQMEATARGLVGRRITCRELTS
ncbi:MAG: IS1595 family transposase [Rhodospirillales bacterium]|nr:IS1595 family transposase [Rhodospirillales bacterium]